MNNDDNSYCRLCAELKPYDKQTDLQTDKEKYREIVTQLQRLHCNLDFKNYIYPKTVCIICLNSLRSSYDFVVGIEKAQRVFNEQIQCIPIKNECSDTENFSYELMDEKSDDIDIKIEIDKDDTDIETKQLKNSKTQSSEEKKDVAILDTIPLAQLKLSWNNYSWMCAYCETQFPNVSELRSHSMKYHKSCTAYRCTDCRIKKLRLDSFLIHIRKHRKYLKLSCHECLMTFSSANERNKHKSSHIISDYKCCGCNTYFSSLDELTSHTNIFYSKLRTRKIPIQTQKDNLTCLICHKKYKSKNSLDAHLLIHTDRKRDHTCEVCGKCFLHKQTLAGHLLLHDDKRPFHCEICKSSFRTKTHLRRHVGTHDGKKPFSCKQCGRRFRLQNQLNSHSIIHTDSLPHICSYCNKGFRFKTILNQHIRQHTGVKPYSCNICQREFTNWPNYNKHMKCKHSMDMAKKKHTPDGVYPIDPATGEVVLPKLQDKVLEWKKKILEQQKPGRPKHKNNLKNKEGVMRE